MKQTLRIYLYTALLIFIPFIFISLILAILSYFIHFNGMIFHSIIQFLSYLILIISALYFTSKLKEKRILHSIIFAIIYFLISLLLQLDDINYIHLILKPMIFIIIGLIKGKIRNK